MKIIQTDSDVVCSEIKESGIDLSQCIPAELLEALGTFLKIIVSRSEVEDDGGVAEILLEIQVTIGDNSYGVNIKKLESANSQVIQLDSQIQDLMGQFFINLLHHSF